MDANEIVAAITERVKDAANVSVVFGDIMETTGGVSVIPVASVKVSGGGGGGTGPGKRRGGVDETTAESQSGLGLGLSVTAKPLGYIEVKGDNARFVPIADVTKIAVGGLLATSLFLVTVNRLMRFKAWKKHRKMILAHR